MGDLAAEGGKIFWVAPSGGRDRPDPATGEYVVAPFDGKALDMFKLVCMQSRKVSELQLWYLVLVMRNESVLRYIILCVH